MTAADSPIDILLIEPNPGDSRLFTESFQDASLTNTIHTVTDGESALDFVNQREPYADEPTPDLILLEPQLPRTTGFEVLAELKGEPALCEIPVVVLTSSSTGERIVKSHDIEADYYLQKPVSADEFLEFVQSVEEFWLTIVQEPAESSESAESPGSPESAEVEPAQEQRTE
ncbi:receiver box response regulator [Natrialba magadii ATCC 43099]|uniref:Receiver box response regulator n=1 Tax=Natrialba magadii (strain ATCC 43099 / DSM 3394 / CCM 3739 / CIP 104546 / IAM 13178 / JCM 8861 / NBRC 102185 / NCIMB 2190 / MS3) TaxID=547559 RepID=D3SRH4_NATMM|nr:response regulator [Natrialba magadii]ADD04679.1 receiver box response regulator [Natrialba magadii ATCC 43099]ELY25335.1 response regulator receiver protein [Natrialba magadii ATCC 43099]